MNKIFLTGLEKAFDITESYNRIIVESNKIFRTVGFEIDKIITLSENDDIIDLSKKAMYVYNPFQLNLSDKKLLTSLYKELIKHMEDEDRILLSEIEKSSLILFENMSIDSSIPIEYSDSLDVGKLFSVFNLGIRIPKDNDYLEVLLYYIKLNSTLLNIKYYFFFGLSNLLTREEQDILEKEASLLEIIVIDFIFQMKVEASLMTIDSDWCII